MNTPDGLTVEELRKLPRPAQFGSKVWHLIISYAEKGLGGFTNQRLLDLVRYQRAELLQAGLLSEDEYVNLLSTDGGPKRLQDYDTLRQQNAELQRQNAELLINRDQHMGVWQIDRKHQGEGPKYDCCCPSCELHRHYRQQLADKERLLREMRQVFDAACALDVRLKVIHADPHYIAVWQCYQNHGGDYTNGPKYVSELKALRQAIDEATKGRGEEKITT